MLFSAAMNDIGDTANIAGIAAFLASSDAGWPTGQWIEASSALELLTFKTHLRCLQQYF